MEKSIKLQKVKRKRKHGYRTRMETHSGQKTLSRRKAKGRHKISL